MATPIPSDWQELVHTMLPTIPLDQLDFLRGYGGDHKGVDVQALWTWKNCDDEKSRGKGEPVCTPIRGMILRVDIERKFKGKDENGNPKPNPHAGRISGIIIVEVDENGNPIENGRVIGLRHMERMINPKTGRSWQRGDIVEAGTQIGTMSDIGCPGKIHLHFEIGTGSYLTRETALVNPVGSEWIDWWNNSIWSLPAWFDRVLPNWGVKCRPDVLEEDEEEEAQYRDPLIVNLDGNGIRTVGIKEGTNFDHDGNGFGEATGWIAPGSGFLMVDRNGNNNLDDGTELFSDFTLLPNGTRAAHGFQALAQYDSNGDGKIDGDDPIWTQLRIWHYAESYEDGDGYDSDPSWVKMSTLDEVGIRAIYLESTIVNRIDDSGNTEVRSGYFEWADGRTGTISEYRLQRDTRETIAAEELEMPPDIWALPNLRGYGNMYTLHQAMVRDSSGNLKALVEAFASNTSSAGRASILDQIIFKWAGVDSVAPDSRGRFMDGRKVAALEQFYGESRGIPTAGRAIAWEQTYRRVSELFYAGLMAQTHLKEIFDLVWCGRCEETNSIAADMTVVIEELNDRLAADPVAGKTVLSEFARSLRALQVLDTAEYLAFREAFIQQDPSLGWVFDTGGLPVYDQLVQGDGWYYPHMFGTWGSDAVKGSLTAGDGVINGLSGDDVIYGTSRNELIYHSDGDALIVAGGGRDTIWAGAGNDILDGGEGSDTLRGETGNDTYILRVGSGRDTVIETDKTAGNVDTIWIGSFLTPNDIAVKRSGNDLVVKIIGTDDTMTVKQFFDQASVSFHSIEQIQFADGTVWDLDEILRREGQPTQSDDYLVGTAEDDTIDALGGNDTVIGQAGSDTLNGGAGNDILIGEAGSDTLNGGTGDDRPLDGAVFHITACNADDCANPLWRLHFPLDILRACGTIRTNIWRFRHVT